MPRLETTQPERPPGYDLSATEANRIIYWVARSKLGMRERGLHPDAHQEALMEIYRCAENHDPAKGSFFGYATACVLWKLLDWRKTVAIDLGRSVPFREQRHGIMWRNIGRPVEELDIDDRLLLYELLDTVLTPREREIVILRCGLFDRGPYTLAEVGRRFNLGHQRVAMIEAKATKKLRQHVSNREHREWRDAIPATEPKAPLDGLLDIMRLARELKCGPKGAHDYVLEHRFLYRKEPWPMYLDPRSLSITARCATCWEPIKHQCCGSTDRLTWY